MDRIKSVSIIVVLVAMMFVPFPSFLGEKTFYAALLHHLWHGNWFHLAVNCLSVWLIVTPEKKISEIVLCWFLASVSYIFATSLVVGFSNILFAMSGMQAARYGKAYWRQPATWTFLAVMLVMSFFPVFSATTHIAAFILGYLFGGIKHIIEPLLVDYERIACR